MKENHWVGRFSRYSPNQIITESPPRLTVGRRQYGSNISLGHLHSYTQPDIENKVKDDSSEKITFFHCSGDLFCSFLLHSKRFAIIVSEKKLFSNGSPPVKSDFVQLLSYSF